MNTLKSVFYGLIAIVSFQGYEAYAMFGMDSEFFTVNVNSSYDSAKTVINNNVEYDRQANINRIAQMQSEVAEKLQKTIYMNHSALVIPSFKNKFDMSAVTQSAIATVVSKPGTFDMNTKATVYARRSVKSHANKENIAGQFSPHARFSMIKHTKQYSIKNIR